MHLCGGVRRRRGGDGGVEPRGEGRAGGGVGGEPVQRVERVVKEAAAGGGDETSASPD